MFTFATFSILPKRSTQEGKEFGGVRIFMGSNRRKEVKEGTKLKMT